MSTQHQQRRWRDSESTPSPAPQLAIQTTFRHMDPSPAVAARIEAEGQKLLRYFDRITRGRAVIVAPHRHRRHGRRYAVHLELTVPGERLVIAHDPSLRLGAADGRPTKEAELHGAHKDIYVVLRKVFDSARRQLEDYVRRKRGEVKQHTPRRRAAG